MKRLVVDGTMLRREGGAPFFWLADTAWELFHRYTPADAARYLETRARQGFTVVQAVLLRRQALDAQAVQGCGLIRR